MKSDLVVIVADGGIEQAIRGIISRTEALGIRSLIGVEFPKLKELDGGTYTRGHELADLYKDTHEHALIVFDLQWEGRPTDNVLELETNVENRLAQQWGQRGRCVVIDPELEVWVWSDSPHVAAELGWDGMPELKRWLNDHELWNLQSPKPDDPKKAFLAAIRAKKIQKSNAIFHGLAQKVSFARCQDRSFQRLVQILRGWFRLVPNSRADAS
jgi:hypothetical protein